MKINETFKRRSIKTIFWSWHVIYLVIAVSLIIPYVLFPMTLSVLEGNTPFYYLFYGFIMALLPFISVAIFLLKVEYNLRTLIRYFYGFEMPLLGFLFIKLILLRESNFSVTLVAINMYIAFAVWLYFLWQENKHQQFPERLINNNFFLAGATIVAITGLYIGSLLSILLFPHMVDFIQSLLYKVVGFKFTYLYFLVNPLFWLFSLFLLFTTTLFLILPIAIVYFYLEQFRKFLPTLITVKKITLVISIIAINSGLFILGNQQPQKKILALLDSKMSQPQAESELLAHQADIKQGLLNAYLMPYRYISTTEDSTNIAYNYKRHLGLSKEMAQIPQTWFQFLASPLYYQGSPNDKEKAEQYYEALFDVPIQKAEKKSIIQAIKYSWELNGGNEASLLTASSHLVHVDQQTINLKEQQGVATIEITESFQNLTQNQQEIVIHFSLPNDAVISGLWLSSDKNKPKMYAYSVAPKGAAQAVYKAEVRRRVDPALLEKVGPNQYRLRVFPIPPKRNNAYFQMQFVYQTLPNRHGQWPLPKILEKRHVFWDDETERTINGEKIKAANKTRWFPFTLANQQTITPQNLDSDTSMQAILRQHDNEKIKINTPLAILIDGSYSMSKHKAVLQQAIQTLKSSVANLDFYFCRKECDVFVDINSAKFFGHSQTTDHLTAFIKQNNAEKYGAVLLLSDEGSYELVAKSSTKDLTIPAPLWMVHLGRTTPYAYDDKVLDLLYRSHGGIATNVKEALLQINPISILKAANIENPNALIAITKDRIWLESNSNLSNNKELEKIIAAQKIHELMRSMDMTKLDNLDRIHAIAKQNSIVTHYSSMLVLVNDQQKEALKKAEAQGDRFEREVEQGKKQLDAFSIPSVPEPEEWALMIIAGILLLLAYQKRRKTEALNSI
ncbi:MAG: TIGR02921 family PEP-CTERM protein [Methylococcales bacterium]|nr:TIGR02921 family PEP-CTERM protein [Methylococcales bacterium]